MNLSVKNVRTHTGREGIGFNADLYLDGKKIAHVLDSANGGSYSYYAEGNDYAAWRELEPKLEAYAKATLKSDYDFENLDSLVGKLANDFLEELALKRKCKTQIIWRTPDMPEGEYMVSKGVLTPEVRAAIIAKKPDAIFANDRF